MIVALAMACRSVIQFVSHQITGDVRGSSCSS